MAEHPDLGGVSVSLNAAVAAIEKNKTAIGDLEKKADQRQKKLADQEATEEQSLTREVERGKKKRAVRTESTRAAEEESAALEGGDRTLVRQTGAVDANTAAIRRQTAAREADTRAAQAQAAANDAASYSGGKYSGAFGGTRQPAIPQAELEARAAARRPGDPTFWPAALGPRERQGFLSRKYEAPDEITQRQNYEALVGKETAERAKLDPYPGGPLGPGKRLVEGGIGAQTIATDDPKVFAKYAARAGFIKAGNKARKEAAAEALAEAKAAAKVESEAVDASVPKLTAAQQRALANPSALYEESGGGFAGGVRNRSARERPYKRLAELGLLEETEAAKTFSSANYARTAEGERALAQAAAPPAPPPPPKPPVAVAPTPEEPERRRRTLAGALTPEEQYRLDQAAGPAAEARALGGTSVSLAPAAAALESKTASKAAAEAKRSAAVEEVEAQKAANARMLEDQRTFEANSLAEAKTYARAKAAAQREASLAAFGGNAERERLAYGLGGGGGGGGGGPKRPPVVPVPPGGDEEKQALYSQRIAQAESDVAETFNRSAASMARYSTVLQRHGALTSEFIQALARGQVTIREFESQMLTTIGKFGGWAIAGGLVYGAYEIVKEFASGISETQRGVEQLKRSLGENVNVPAAESGFRKVSKEVNVPIQDVANAQFFAARAFQNQPESLEVAKLATEASKLDEIAPEEAARAFGAVAVNFGLSAKEIGSIFDLLDAGQQKFNARLNQTLPQMARASAAFANAGGTAKQLAEQLIELNRVTIAGGQGGGNPATALIREPSNLAKSASESVLRRYGFDPKFAQEHIGTYNEEVQRRAAIAPGAPGALGNTAQQVKEAIKALAGASFSPQLGQRYGIPLFTSGQTLVSPAVQAAAAHAAGSAQEDLNHKLSQFDERVKSVGITLQNIGSELGSTGLGNLGVDLVTTLSVGAKGVGLALTPLAKLGEIAGALPGPLRLLVEGLLLLRGATAISRSEKFLALRGIAEQATGAVYGSASAAEVLGAQTTQKEIADRAQRLAAQKADSAYSAAFSTKVAIAQARALEAAPVAVGTAERDAYDLELADAQKTAIAKIKSLGVLETELLAAEQEAVAQAELLNTLMDKRIAGQAKLAALSESGAFIASEPGFPNRGPLLAPNEQAAAREVERTGSVAAGATPGGVILPQGAAKAAQEAQTVAEESAAATETVVTEAAATEGALAATIGVLGSATLAITALPKLIAGLGTKLLDFVEGLGLLGKGITGLVLFEVLAQVAGANDLVKGEEGRIKSLQAPKSEDEARSLVRTATEHAKRQRDGGESVTDFLGHGIAESKALVNKGLNAIPVVGGLLAGSTTREHDRVEKEYAEAEKVQKALKAGKFKGLGQGTGLGEGQIAEALTGYDKLIGSIEKEGSAGEKAFSEMQKYNAHLVSQLKLFGNKSYGHVALQLAAGGTGHILLQALTHPETPGLLEGASSNLESLVPAIEGAFTAEAKREAQFAKTTKQRQVIVSKLRASQKALLNTITGEARQYITKNISDKEGDIDKIEAKEFATPSASRRARLEGDANKLKGEIVKAHSSLAALAQITNNLTQQFAQELSSIFEGIQIKGIEAHTKLLQAQAGGNQQLKDEIGAQGEDKILKLKEKLAQTPAEKTGLKEEREAKKLEDRNKIEGGTQYEKAKRAAERATLGAGPGQVEQSSAALTRARAEANYVAAHKQALGPEKLEEANLAVAKAEKDLSEATVSRSESLSALTTEIEEAEHEGDPLAQAQAAERGAARLAAEARTPEQAQQAVLAGIKARNQRRKAQLEEITGKGELRESQEANPAEKEKTHLKTLNEELPFADKVEKRKLLADKNNTVRSLTETRVSEGQSQIDFELHTEKINNSVAIKRIDGLLKLKGLSQATRRQLESKRYDLENEQGSTDFAVTNVPQPTVESAGRLTLDNRLKASAAARGLGLPKVTSSRAQPLSDSKDVAVAANYSHLLSPQLHQVNHISVVVQGGHPGQVVNELERAFRTQTKAQLRSARLVG